MKSPLFGTVFAVLLVAAITACADDSTLTPTRQAPGTVAANVGAAMHLPASIQQKADALKADLEARGYEVAQGYWTLWGIEQCRYPLQALGYCYGNNPTAPYALAVVPQWKDEFVDPRMQHVLTQAQRSMSATYRLDAREALVVLADLPPEARYFGMGTNVFSREASLNESDPILPRVAADPLLKGILFGASPDPARRMMISSIGNSTNNVIIQRQSGSVWGQQRYFVITPNAAMADSMTAALLRAGVPTSDDVFTEPVSPSLVRVGLGRGADDFITYIRYAMPTDDAAGEQWRKELPLTVLRVRDTDSSHPTSGFPIPAYETRSWNFDETTLAGDLTALLEAVRAHWNQPQADTVPFFSAYRYLDLVGQHCLGYPDPARGPMDCLGDTQDADYQISPSMRIDDGQVIAVVGTLATRTGNATYASLSVNWFPELVGVKNISDVALDGTAAPFAAALQHDARYFYVYYVARDCTGLQNCIEIPRKLVPTGDIIKVIQRNYVNPGSAAGPEPTKMLNPRFIVLDGNNRPPAQ